jgi:hypothetical protein
MNSMSRARWLALIPLALLAAGPAAEEKIGVKVVKYAGLAQAVKQFRGKVVVIDFWADW